MDSVMLCSIHLAADIRSVSFNFDNLKAINIVGDAACPSGVIFGAGLLIPRRRTLDARRSGDDEYY